MPDTKRRSPHGTNPGQCGYGFGQTFTCAKCLRQVCYCEGAHLDGDGERNDWCNDCWSRDEKMRAGRG